MSWLFASVGQSIRDSASVLSINNQDLFPLRLTGLVSLQSKGFSRVFSNTTVQKNQSFGTQPLLWSNCNIWISLLEKKKHSLNYMDFFGKVISLLFNMLPRFFITFRPRSKHLLISWPQSPSEVILESKKRKSVTPFISIFHEVMEPDDMILVFWMLNFKPAFSLTSFPTSRDCLVPL